MNWWKDRRKKPQCLVGASLVIALMAWIVVSVAVGQSLPATADQTVRVSDLVRFQWWALTGMLGLIGVLVGFIIVREMNGTKAKVRDLYEKKLDKEAHGMIDHSPLCAACRDAHLISDRSKDHRRL